MIIRNAVGPYPSRRANDYIVIVDPIGPPKKCPYNCIYCPMGSTVVKTDRVYSLIPPKKILDDYSHIMEKIEYGVKIILFNGMGDPFLNYFLENIVEEIKGFNREHGLDMELWVKTTLAPLVYHDRKNLLGLFDRVYVVFDSGSLDDLSLINDPVNHVRIRDLVRYISSLDIDVIAETTLVNIGGEGNWVSGSLELIASWLGRAGVKQVLLKTLSRPPRSMDAKPVSKKILYSVREYFIEHGFSVTVLWEGVKRGFGRIVLYGEDDLYSLLLRRPMDLLELHNALELPIRDIAYLLSKLENSGLIERIPWRTRIFYRGVYRR